MSFGDYDLDGFLDVYFGMPGRLYRNRGNDNHWLRVELVGIQSNRSGIGARVIATSGELTQTREILGGLGYCQDELVAHFGLGSRTQVDRLEIRWPSGQVDVLGDIPADQKIQVFEGRATSVEASEVKAIPSSYALSQNVPNPFNPITTIAYDLPQASNVTLTIYAITGQKVAVLVDGRQEAGHHTVRFDGSGFGTGVYLYRLEAEGLVETRRMLLLK